MVIHSQNRSEYAQGSVVVEMFFADRGHRLKILLIFQY